MVAFFGRVVHGQKFGRRLGFPTANLDRRGFSRKKIRIRWGVWGGYAYLASGRRYLAGIVIGPKDHRGLPKLEAHLLGYSGRLYGRRIRLEPKKFIRPYSNFSDIKTLRVQIAKDLKSIKASL